MKNAHKAITLKELYFNVRFSFYLAGSLTALSVGRSI